MAARWSSPSLTRRKCLSSRTSASTWISRPTRKSDPGAHQVARPPLLDKRIAYQFKSGALREQAVTHRSFGSPLNERLEFLGDGVLNCVIAEELYTRFPTLSEGQLSRLRANLVRKDSL